MDELQIDTCIYVHQYNSEGTDLQNVIQGIEMLDMEKMGCGGVAFQRERERERERDEGENCEGVPYLSLS